MYVRLWAADIIKYACRDGAKELKDVSRHVYDDFLHALEDGWDGLVFRSPPITGLAMAKMTQGHDTASQERAAAPYADALRAYVTQRAKMCLAPIDREMERIAAHLDSVIASAKKDLAACGMDIDLGAGMERRHGSGVRNMASLVRRSPLDQGLDNGPWVQVRDPMISAVLLAARQTPISSAWILALRPGPLAPRVTTLFWTALRRAVTDYMSQTRELALSGCDGICADITREGAAIAGDIRAGLPAE